MSLWIQVNRKLIAKSLSELSFEEILKPNQENDHYVLKLQSGTRYLFKGGPSVWDQVVASSDFIKRVPSNGAEMEAVSAGQFFIDAQVELGMDDITLAHFLEEMQSTLWADQIILQKSQSVSARDMSAMSGLEIQSYLPGHPKILLNKGRKGWGVSDSQKYGPESGNSFQLRWLSIDQKRLRLSSGAINWNELYLQSLTPEELSRFSRPGHLLLPVHPWQWDHVIQFQFAGEIRRNEILDLGFAGDYFRPQISLRTLTNVTRPGNFDIKLPLTILNTSAYRGLSVSSVIESPQIAKTVFEITQNDSFFRNRPVDVLQEIAGIAVLPDLQSQIKDAPYRYQETLGAIWRESSESKTHSQEQSWITGALFYQDSTGRSLLGEVIQKSNLSVTEWLEAYFNCVVIPLYHFQLKHGLGLVAHGQNIILKMKNHVPVGMMIKDFQGDLRISERSQLPESLKKNLTILPSHHLLHDLFTGHFVTVLRFAGQVLHQSHILEEEEFYKILSAEISNYLDTQNDVPEELNLLKPKIERVLLNKVRFQIGYQDSIDSLARPRPTLGTELSNPLFEGAAHG